jgi:hypothetical protein
MGRSRPSKPRKARSTWARLFPSLRATLVGRQRIEARHQALARILRRTDLGQILFIEQGQLQAPGIDQPADRRPARRRDPPQSGRLLEFADLGFGEHAAVANQNQAGEIEPLPRSLDPIADGGGIAGVAGINTHRHRTAFGVREQAADGHRQSVLAVAVLAVTGQGTSVSFAVTGADVVAHQRSIAQVTPVESLLDVGLACQQPGRQRHPSARD